MKQNCAFKLRFREDEKMLNLKLYAEKWYKLHFR